MRGKRGEGVTRGLTRGVVRPDIHREDPQQILKYKLSTREEVVMVDHRYRHR